MIIFIKKEVGTEVSDTEGLVICIENGIFVHEHLSEYTKSNFGKLLGFHELEDRLLSKDKTLTIKTVIIDDSKI